MKAHKLAVGEFKQKHIIHLGAQDGMVKEEVDCVKPAPEVEERMGDTHSQVYFSHKKPLSKPAEHQKSDSENNVEDEKVADKVHPRKKSLVELMQKKLNSGKGVIETELKTNSRTCQAFEVKTEAEAAELVISNIKLPCSIIAQTQLLHLVKRTGTVVKYRFS